MRERRRFLQEGTATTSSLSWSERCFMSCSASCFIPSSSVARCSAAPHSRASHVGTGADKAFDRPRHPRAKRRRADRLFDILSRAYRPAARSALRPHPRRRLARHGDARLETTVPVPLDMMILQALAVMRGSKRALVVVDMPFGSYEASREQAFMSAARVMKETGCGAIKLEGGRRMAETIAFLVERGVPVMGHIGLTPQSINTIGAFRAQGREEAHWGPIEADAKGVAADGAFSA